MKVRNTMCIFTLFSIMALFFCFGVVVNAEETETKTYSYSASFRNNSVDSYFLLTLKFESSTPVCYVKDGNKYTLTVSVVDDTGTLISPSVKCNGARYYSDGKLWYEVKDDTSNYNGELSNITGNIPIFDISDMGTIKEYLKTGNEPATVPILDDKSHYDEAYYFIDFKATDFVNASWSGMGSTVKIKDDGHTIINHLIAVKYIYGYRGMSVENHTLSAPYPNSGNSLSIDFTTYKPTKDELYISAVVYTPYYTSGSSYFYGRSVSVLFSPSGKVQKVTSPVVDGDYEQVLPPLDGMSNYDDGFKLIDFKTDKTGYSTWNGCTEKKYDPYNYTKDTAYVSVTLGYAYKTAPGQIALKYDTDLGFLISANKASINMSALAPEIVLKGKKNSNGIEYDTSQVFLRYIKYTPCYNYGGYVFYGKSNDIYLKVDGSTDVTYTDRDPTNGDQNQGGGLGDLTNIKPSEIFGYFTNLIQTLVNSVQNVAPFINNIFGFLPSELRTCVYATFGVICACAMIRAIVGIFIH